MLAETIPASEFGYPNSVLAKTAPFFLQASRSFAAPASPRRYCRLVREIATLFPGRGIFSLSADSLFKVQSAFLTKQKSRYTHSMYRPCKKGRLPPWQVQQIEYMYRLCKSKSVIRLMAFRGALLVCARPHI